MPKIFISAGDPSGDVHAARLMQKILASRADVEFIGIGGRNMAKLGLNSIAKIKDISVVGFWEVAKKYGFFRNLLQKSKEIIAQEKIDLFIPVDYPGFNLNLAQFAKSEKVPVVYFIAPQLWAWGKNRANKLASRVDKLLVVFPFEEEYFRSFGIDASFIGHPLLDNPIIKQEQRSFDDRENIIALLAGSRPQELKSHLDIYLKAAIQFRERHKDFRIVLAKAGDIDFTPYSDFFKQNGIETTNDSLELMAKSKLGIVKTGTSNLEAALMEMPFVMAYRTSLFSYLISKQLINLEHVSIVNILQKKPVINELIQSEATSGNIASALEAIYSQSEARNNMISEFRQIRHLLGDEGACSRAKDYILEYL